MSVREYIGARYIMKFADPIQHDSTKSYEPLTVVQYEGASYISRKAVPVGIAITNTEYWIRMADFNAQIELYRQESQRAITIAEEAVRSASDAQTAAEDAQKAAEDAATAATTGIANEAALRTAADDDLQDAIDAEKAARIAADAALNTLIGDNATAIATETAARTSADSTLSNAIATEESRRIETDESLQSQIDALVSAQPIMVIFGDSWSNFSTHPNWAELAGIQPVLNVSIRNYSTGGASFLGNNNSVYSQVALAEADLTADEKLAVKYIVITAGVNDTSNSAPDYTTIAAAIDNVINAARAFMPNALIVFAPTICGFGNTSSQKQRIRTCMTTFTRYINDMPKRNIPNAVAAPNTPYFWVGNMSSDVFDSDLLHINANGAKMFGKMILAACTGQNAAIRTATFASRNIVWMYNALGFCEAHGNVRLDGNNSSFNSGMNPFCEFLEIFHDIITGNRLWFGSNGNANQFAWIRYAGSGEIEGHGPNGSSEAVYYF